MHARTHTYTQWHTHTVHSPMDNTRKQMSVQHQSDISPASVPVHVHVHVCTVHVLVVCSPSFCIDVISQRWPKQRIITCVPWQTRLAVMDTDSRPRAWILSHQTYTCGMRELPSCTLGHLPIHSTHTVVCKINYGIRRMLCHARGDYADWLSILIVLFVQSI